MSINNIPRLLASSLSVMSVLFTVPAHSNEALADFTQIGSAINGNNTEQFLGQALAISSTGSIVAIGSPGDEAAGNVRVYRRTENGWQQVGNDFSGDGSEDGLGFSVALSDNGRRLAIGSPGYSNKKGRLQVYESNLVFTNWQQLGSDIIGSEDNSLLGYSVALNGAGDGLAYGVPGHERCFGTNTNIEGYAEVRYFGSSDWQPLGNRMTGSADAGFGHSIALSTDGSRLAVGSPCASAGVTSNAGRVEVFDYDNVAWAALDVIEPSSAQENARFGHSTSMSGDGSKVAVGAPYFDGENGTDTGKAWVWAYYDTGAGETGWSWYGAPIEGSLPENLFGNSVSLSGDGTRLAIGVPRDDMAGFGSDWGKAVVVQWDDNFWTALGDDMYGLAPDDWFGSAVSLSSNGKRVVISAPYSDAYSSNAGQVRIFSREGQQISAGVLWFLTRGTATEEEEAPLP